MMMPKLMGMLVLLLAFAMAGQGVAGEADGTSFLRTELQVLGTDATVGWRGQNKLAAPRFEQSDGADGNKAHSEFGSAAPEAADVAAEGGNTSNKIKAGLMSAVLPGAGQYYNGQHQKAYIMGGIEVAIWTAYFVFDNQGDNKREDAEEWAAIYAGTSGDHEDRYWQDVGHYADSESYNEALLREARALGESTPTLLTGADAWLWVNEDRQDGYSSLRADANSAYDRRDFMILFAVLNRTVSVVDAVIGAGKKPGVLEAEVLGMNMELQMLPSFQDPGALCVVSRSF